MSERKLNILVTEDKPIHLTTLEGIRDLGHAVDVSTSFSQSKKLISEKKYDILLTDLFFPYGNVGYAAQSDTYNEHPLGFPLIFVAARAGIESIALVTDCNHHSNAVANTFDALYATEEERKNNGTKRPFFRIDKSRVIMLDERDFPGIYKTLSGKIGGEDELRKNEPKWYEGCEQIKNYMVAFDLLMGKIGPSRELNMGSPKERSAK